MAGPGRGFSANFMSLVCNKSVSGRYFAYADQDDVWEPEKLARAIAWLDHVSPDIPALYCSRTLLIDSRDRSIGYSPDFSRPPSFRNALVQSLAGGNTMVFNSRTRLLLSEIGAEAGIVTHDWMTYLVVAACGGRVCMDPLPQVRYRQHGNNIIGSGVGFIEAIRRTSLAWDGSFRSWISANVYALNRIRQHITNENIVLLDTFLEARDMRLIPRVIGLWRSGVYRQTLRGNISLAIAGLCGKI